MAFSNPGEVTIMKPDGTSQVIPAGALIKYTRHGDGITWSFPSRWHPYDRWRLNRIRRKSS
jgi:hypothetical protein